MSDVETKLAICDDHPIVRSGIRALLDRTPDLRLVVEIESLAGLASALDAEPVALVLLDVDLPDGSGLDVIEALATRTKVLVLSALAEPRTVRKALERGAVGYVRKDASPDELVRSIRRALAGQTALSADVAMTLADSMRGDSEATRFREKIAALSSRQREVVELVAEGRSNRDIAKALFLSEGTVKNYVSHILDAVGVADRTRLAVMVSKHGFGR